MHAFLVLLNLVNVFLNNVVNIYFAVVLSYYINALFINSSTVFGAMGSSSHCKGKS